MKMSEKYGLIFKRVILKNYNDFRCEYSTIPGSYCAADLLQTFRLEAPYLIKEIDAVLQDEYYDEIFLPDFGFSELRFDPPNAIFNNDFTIPLIDLKILLKEWIEFMKKENSI